WTRASPVCGRLVLLSNRPFLVIVQDRSSDVKKFFCRDQMRGEQSSLCRPAGARLSWWRQPTLLGSRCSPSEWANLCRAYGARAIQHARFFSPCDWAEQIPRPHGNDLEASARLGFGLGTVFERVLHFLLALKSGFAYNSW